MSDKENLTPVLNAISLAIAILAGVPECLSKSQVNESRRKRVTQFLAEAKYATREWYEALDNDSHS